MSLHTRARELIVFRVSLVVLGPIDQVHHVVDLAVGDGAEKLGTGFVLQTVRQALKQSSDGVAYPLCALELIRVGSGTARILDLFLSRFDFGYVAGKIAPGAP